MWACFALWAFAAHAQDAITDTGGIILNKRTERDLGRLAGQAQTLTASLQQQSLHLLDRLQRKDAALQNTIRQKDSSALKASQQIAQQYNAWRQRLTALNSEATSLSIYIPRLDSLQTALRFLHVNTAVLNSVQLNSLQGLSIKLSALSGKLQQAAGLSNFLSTRQASLQQQLTQLGMLNKLTTYKQQLYYYKAQVVGYKNLLNDPDKLTNTVMALVRSRPAFQQYFQQHSYLSTLFRLPGNSPATGAGKPIPGLQTRAQTTALVQARLGKNADLSTALAAGGSDNNAGSNPLAGGMQQARQQLSQWKAKLAQYGGTGSSSDPMPDFQPNPQHNKTFLQRLQLGWDLQTQSSSYYIPALSTVGLSVGYILNSKSVVGIGAGYILGWGEPFNHITLSSQGASLRGFLHWKLKGSLWASGGLEMNYLNAFTGIDQLRSFSAWQSSALVGLMKPYKAGHRSGNLQLLFDALYKQHVPQSQPVVFRIGYSLN